MRYVWLAVVLAVRILALLPLVAGAVYLLNVTTASGGWLSVAWFIVGVFYIGLGLLLLSFDIKGR